MRPNLFTLLFLAFIAISGVIGSQAGFMQFGYSGGFIGGAVGVTFGYFVASWLNRGLNFLMERHIRRKSTPALRAKLDEDDISGTYVSSLIISVLLERLEPTNSFAGYILRQLRSEDLTWRKAGRCNLSLCYPELAKKLNEFDIVYPTKEYLEWLNEIESIISSSASRGSVGLRE